MSMLNNAISGLNASNVALTVAGQNVANAAVEGYSRQAIQLQTAGNKLGGVEVLSVDRLVSSFLNEDIWRTNSDLSEYESKQTYLGFMEEVLGTESVSIDFSIAELGSALSAAATSPESLAYRQQVITSAKGLVQDLAQISTAFSGQVTKLSSEMNNVSINASSVTEQIAELNASIAKATSNGQPSAELKDSREKLISELSDYIGVATIERADGMVDISTLSGAPLVIGIKGSVISASGTNITTTYLNQKFDLDGNVGGQLGGLIKANDEVIEPTLASLDSLVADLADEVNLALQSGFDLNSNPGVDLFDYNATSPLASITVSDTITTEELAFKSTSAAGPGDNSNITNVLSAIDGKGDRYISLVGDLAIMSKQNQSSITTAQDLNENAIISRDSLSGVNLDEEAASLMYFQQMYSANAKVVSTADEIFNALIQMF